MKMSRKDIEQSLRTPPHRPNRLKFVRGAQADAPGLHNSRDEPGMMYFKLCREASTPLLAASTPLAPLSLRRI